MIKESDPTGILEFLDATKRSNLVSNLETVEHVIDKLRTEVAAECPCCRKHILKHGYDHDTYGCGSGGEFSAADALRQRLEELDVRPESIADACGEAQCGCVYHAEDGFPCQHDLALLLVKVEREMHEDGLIDDAFCAEARWHHDQEVLADQVSGVTFNGKPLQASDWQ